MTCRKIIGIFAKYLPFAGILALHIFSLYNGATTIIDEMNRNIHIWTNTLMISAIVSEIGSLLVLDRFNILVTGKTPNFVQDIWEESSQDVAVRYNGMIVSSLFISVIFALNIIYTTTGKRVFSSAAVLLATLWAIGTIVYIFAGYFKIKHIRPQSVFSKLSDPAILPPIIGMIQILITRKNWVGYVYHSIYKPANDVLLTLGLIIMLCYILAIAFCHFSNIYCLIGFRFIKRDFGRIQRKIDYIQEKEEQQELLLRQTTKDIDERGEQGNFINKIGLIVPFFILHIKVYTQQRFCAASYLLSLLNFRVTKRFSGLLEPERIRLNGIRFCLVTAVLELLSLDFVLFIYFENNAPCLKFFELLSTVIIIPILLSWLAELKSKTNERNRSEMEAKEK